MKSTKNTIILILMLIFLAAGCNDSLFSPPDENNPSPGGSTAFGLVEVTISGIGTDHMIASAKPAQSNVVYDLTELPGSDGTIQLKPVSNGSFTYGTRGSGGVRYIYATFKVRNAAADGTAYSTERTNLTFIAADTPETFGVTAISELRLFDGTLLSGTGAAAIAEAAVPTGQVAQNGLSDIIPTSADVLQVFTENDVSAIPAPAGVEIFPYGFITRSPGVTSGSRMLPANPASGQFDGVVTFAFKLPLQIQANQDPFEISAMFLPVDDTEMRITQSLEEQVPDAQKFLRKQLKELDGIQQVTLLPGGLATGAISRRLLCDPVRTAGQQTSPTTFLFPDPPVFQSLIGVILLGFGGQFTVEYDANVLHPPNANNFVIHGSQTGRHFLNDNYAGGGVPSGGGNARVVTPIAHFFPGEVVEATATTALGGCKPHVKRFRAPTASAPGTFSTPENFPAGDFPFSITAGDFNGDGELDLATANNDSDDVAVIMNDAGSIFTVKSYKIGDDPISITTGDFDGDGDLDLATANFSSANISILINDGNGTFATVSNIPAAEFPLFIKGGDLDGDGDLDLVGTGFRSDQVFVHFNNGDGTFTASVNYAAGGNPSTVSTGDFDGDSDLDLALANRGTDNLTILRNIGYGSFIVSLSFNGLNEPEIITSGDLDGDGDIDLVTANETVNNSITVYFNGGSGVIVSTANYDLGTQEGLSVGDVDGDGDLDLFTSNSDTHEVLMLFNDGNGNFGAPIIYEVGFGPTGIISGDFNGDGRLDLATANTDTDNISILYNEN